MSGIALVRVARDYLRLINMDDVYMLEAEGGATRIHRRGTEPLRDARTLSDVLHDWPEHPFVRIHEAYAVHPIHVLELRLRDTGRDWELQLEPPLNDVLPISRGHAPALWEALGG